MKKIIVGALAVVALAFGGVAYAQQEAPGQNQQGPQQSQQERSPGGGGYGCPEKEGGAQQTEV